MATFIHNIVNIDQAPKLLKDQIKMNLIVDKSFLLINELYQHNEVKNHYVYTLVYDKC